MYSINTFEDFLKQFVYIYTLQSPCIAWMEMKNCSKSLRILVTTLHFMNRNWISKTVFSKTFPYAAFRTFSYANHMQDYTDKESPAFLCDSPRLHQQECVVFFLPRQVKLLCRWVVAKLSLSCFLFSCDLLIIGCYWIAK